MAVTAISCSSGCALKIRSIRNRQASVKRRTWSYQRPRENMSLEPLDARLNIFTLRGNSEEEVFGLSESPCNMATQLQRIGLAGTSKDAGSSVIRTSCTNRKALA